MRYKILSFDAQRGVITINYEGYQPYAWSAPVADGAYLSGDALDKWIKANFHFNGAAFGGPEMSYDGVSGGDDVIAMVDGTPFPVTVVDPNLAGDTQAQPITSLESF